MCVQRLSNKRERCEVDSAKRLWDAGTDTQTKETSRDEYALCAYNVFFFTVTYHGRRDADYTVVIGSRATGTASCLVLLLCYLAGFHTATGQGGASFKQKRKKNVKLIVQNASGTQASDTPRVIEPPPKKKWCG